MSNNFLTYFYLLSPLHTGGTAQEGNVVGIAREVHTNFPYLPSSSTRGKLRAEVDFDPSDSDAEIKARIRRIKLFGPDLKDIQDTNFLEDCEILNERKLTQLEQGSIWIGDASILWIPVPSISHGVIWISCPLLLQRWMRQQMGQQIDVDEYSSNLPKKGTLYLKDATIPGNKLKSFPNGKTWSDFVPHHKETSINSVLVVPNRYCETLIEMSLWRQVKVKLNEHKVVTDGSFRYEEAIPPDTLMYFPWGEIGKPQHNDFEPRKDFQDLLDARSIIQFGGQESLGRGFVRQWTQTDRDNSKKEKVEPETKEVEK